MSSLEKKRIEAVWSCMISGSASWFIFPLAETVMPDVKADSSVNMVIMRSMNAEWPSSSYDSEGGKATLR